MYEQVDKPKGNKSRAVANAVVQKKSGGKQGFGFVDNRPATATPVKVQSTNSIMEVQGNNQNIIETKQGQVRSKALTYMAQKKETTRNKLLKFGNVIQAKFDLAKYKIETTKITDVLQTADKGVTAYEAGKVSKQFYGNSILGLITRLETVQNNAQEDFNFEKRIREEAATAIKKLRENYLYIEIDSSGRILEAMQHGLRRPSRMEKFERHVTLKQECLSDNATSGDWVQSLALEIAARLAKSTVPVPKLMVLRQGSGDYDSIFGGGATGPDAAFDRKQWMIFVNGEKYNHLGSENATSIANSVYHEARHAEQTYWGIWVNLMQNTTGPFLTSKKDIVEQVRRRIERGDKPINLPVKLLLGEASERSTKDFEQRPPEERTREAYRSDFHEVDAYATQPFGEEDDGVFRMGEGSQDTDFSDRSSGRATRVRFDLSSLAYREPEELDGAESSPPQDFSDRDSLHTEDGDEYEGGVSS